MNKKYNPALQTMWLMVALFFIDIGQQLQNAGYGSWGAELFSLGGIWGFYIIIRAGHYADQRDKNL